MIYQSAIQFSYETSYLYLLLLVIMLDVILDPIVLVGLLVMGGISFSVIFQKFGIPHVVVYIITGFLLSNTIFAGTVFLTEYTELFHIVEIAALGLIGFKIGTELNIEVLRSKTRTLTGLVLGNTGFAFILVTIVVFIFSSSYNSTERWIFALVLGAVATATAPAATVEIIRKYKAEGVITKLVMAVLALNDLVAILLVEVMLVLIRGAFTTSFELDEFAMGLLQEIGLSVVLGLIIGLVLDTIVEKMRDDIEMMELTLGFLIFTIGLTNYLQTSHILTAMIVGITVTNRKGNNYEKAGDLLEVIMSPIITLFFVLVGAKILLSDFSPFPFIVLVYFLLRILGKYIGSFLGARAIGESGDVQKYFGFTMVPQGGVALGLAAIIGETLLEVDRPDLSHIVVSVIVIGTVFSEILGTFTAKYGLMKAGEIKSNVPISEEGDHLRILHVHD